MALRFAPDADRRHHGVPLAAQPDIVRLLTDLTLSVFATGVLCVTFSWLDRPVDPVPERPAVAVGGSPVVADADGP